MVCLEIMGSRASAAQGNEGSSKFMANYFNGLLHDVLKYRLLAYQH
jgi:hypothetical protein